ncbi:MAG: branched-chain amino acid transport system II carrier protein [Actinomycetaceae bacterium]|nr:branched-chain amino acid transport system II carrier protein [Arcanobacterium sp.]MDD7505218.1 branched-chain amino acid transport system II carrier protein [Actinomycetaceae bacterium]MDY6143306.1 branched-chain amino acid transport system II carrier protein [Arcanobacterium sp.]
MVSTSASHSRVVADRGSAKHAAARSSNRAGSTPTRGGSANLSSILLTGLALFAMFFGAGNLILPVMIGIEGGSSASIVTAGFVITGVALPVLAMVAAATSEEGIEGIASRIGRIPGLVFCWMAMLTTGVLYAVPRVATVSFQMSAGAIGDLSGTPGSPGLLIYTLIFMLVTAVLVLNPDNLMVKIGGWLTPALLVLMIALIVAALLRLTPVLDEPAEAYRSTPFISGLLTGYNTLDALASLIFGTVIITSLRSRGVSPGKPLFRATASSGIVAGLLLAGIYLGLSQVGVRIGNADVPDGAAGISYAASLLFGAPGQWLLAVIAILACLTTAVGLIGASTQFFQGQFPRIPRIALLVIHVVVALAVANLGLATLMNIVVPMMYFCYPVTIAVVVASIIDIVVPGHLYHAYRIPVWTAALFGLLDAVAQSFKLFGAEFPGWLDWLIGAVPLADISLGWVVPAGVMLVLGLVLDAATGRFARQTAL